jgi:1-deoxy-D-xylulose-5-phosphate reductoisomerase
MSRTLAILGATGSVGRSTLDLVEREPERWRVRALSADTNARELARQAIRTRAEIAVVADERAYADLKDALNGSGIEAAAGAQALSDAADADIVMAAIVGAAGLRPTLRAVQRGATVAIANKETLVCAGELVRAAAAKSGARLLPVDSEHNAIYQCFDFDHPERIARVILTCSGGPFREATTEQMRAMTPAQAVKHPVWSMGGKISVDSATLMNKGLELIEAWHLFPVSVDQLSVLIHPQSVVHSMVEYVDGSTLAQLGTPDMRIPIAYALAWPDRMQTPCARLDLAKVGRLDFAEPDTARFPALGLAWAALRAGGAATNILNAANEIAVAAFLDGRIGFLDIAATVGDTLAAEAVGPMFSLEDVIAIDAAARTRARAIVETRTR